MKPEPKPCLIAVAIASLLLAACVPDAGQSEPSSSITGVDHGTYTVAGSPEPVSAFPYREGRIPVDRGMVESIEFLQDRCNLTIANRGSSPVSVGYTVHVLNEDDAVVWRGTTGTVDVANGEVATVSLGAVDFAIPERIRWSDLAVGFDPSPRWIIIE